MEGHQTTIREAADKRWFNLGSQAATDSRPPSIELPDSTPELVARNKNRVLENKPLPFTLKGVQSDHPYLKERGITEETANDFGVGFFPGRGSMHGRIVIPIHNERGELVAYAGRSIDNSEPKYRFPTGFHKSLVLFNRHRVNGDHIVLVEGFVDCIKVSQSGFPCVALMGRTLSEAQEKLLAFKKIILLLDGDQPAKEAMSNLALKLACSHYIRSVSIEGQPDQKSTEELKAILAPVI